MGRPGFSPWKKLTGGKFRPVTPVFPIPELELIDLDSRLLKGSALCRKTDYVGGKSNKIYRKSKNKRLHLFILDQLFQKFEI